MACRMKKVSVSQLLERPLGTSYGHFIGLSVLSVMELKFFSGNCLIYSIFSGIKIGITF